MTDPGATLRKKLKPRTLARGPCCDVLEAEGPGIFRKTAKSLLKLDLVVGSSGAKRLPAAAALADLPDPCLPMIVTAPGERLGLFVLDGALVDGLIEQQLLGYVARAPRVERPVTRIDAELSRGFVAAILKSLTVELVEEPRARAVCGFATPVMETDRATLDLAMTAPAYDVLSLSLDLGPGQKQAEAQLWFPEDTDPDAETQADGPTGWQAQMRENVMAAPLCVEARLPSLPISIAEFAGLQIGSILPLPAEALREAELVDAVGNQVARGKLGQLNGNRAFRIGAILSDPTQTEAEVLPAPEPADLAEIDTGMVTGLDAGLELGIPAGAPLDMTPDLGPPEDLPEIAPSPMNAPLPMHDAPEDSSELPDFPAMAQADFPVSVE
ncbi:MAG: FliM/FliN family flagellar motor switch protein [Litoreibacter sp.]|nr:FliM/FliN family flagellar motor switch protein [Litoreibacter sp.]